MPVLLRSHILPLILAAILFIVSLNSIESIHRWMERQQPAIQWHGVETITKTVAPGQVLTIEYSATVHKQCPSDLRTFLIAEDGSVPVRFPTVAGGYSLPSDGPRNIRVNILLPQASDPGLAPLHTGPHVYRTLATRYCPEGVEEDVSIPDAPFRLEVPQ